MTNKWYNLPDDYIPLLFGKHISYTCYICNIKLGLKENNNHYFHNNFYELLFNLLTMCIGVKDIGNIIIKQIK